jgi:hypothetical protein
MAKATSTTRTVSREPSEIGSLFFMRGNKAELSGGTPCHATVQFNQGNRDCKRPHPLRLVALIQFIGVCGLHVIQPAV